MVLVAYSDSEGSGSDSEQPAASTKPVSKATSSAPPSNFNIDKANPRRIRVNLQNAAEPATDSTDSEPAAKRPRVGAGAFSGFNAMLPAPKRDIVPQSHNNAKAPTRKVFSLKTGAEPGFSRESDAELRYSFAERDDELISENNSASETIPSFIPKTESQPADRSPELESAQPASSKPFMFKPLSVARNTKKKKKPVDAVSKSMSSTQSDAALLPNATVSSNLSNAAGSPQTKKKVNLFGSATDLEDEIVPDIPTEVQEDQGLSTKTIDEDSVFDQTTSPILPSSYNTAGSEPQSLNSIASDLKLSSADRRQLFGRGGKGSNTAINVVNFNTDQEYAANQSLRESGDQVQHNPVRAIASGKHSLKQLVASASGQKEALEESFASGRRNKREAGSKYGW